MRALFLVCGAVFGFLLSRSGVTDYGTMLGLFRFENLHVGGVMALAIATAAAGLALLGRGEGKALAGCPIEIPSKPMRKGIALAGIVFGTGWALTGT
ncbi:MAG TPA: DUF6691 family protein [Planctomycetota bacterium]|nr:DUF6691 family protein [Planctomycetota bacterium]